MSIPFGQSVLISDNTHTLTSIYSFPSTIWISVHQSYEIEMQVLLFSNLQMSRSGSGKLNDLTLRNGKKKENQTCLVSTNWALLCFPVEHWDTTHTHATRGVENISNPAVNHTQYWIYHERVICILTELGLLLATAGRATGKAAGVGGAMEISPTGSLATSILTEFPQFLSTCATCSLVIPCTFVLPIFKMWSPVWSLPSFNPRKKKIIMRNHCSNFTS